MAEYSNVERIPLVTIAGPTAAGKSAAAVSLAEILHGEVVSADSMQVYIGLSVGTAKIKKEEMRGIPHHLIDIVEPDVEYSVADYVPAAEQAIAEIWKRGKLPILCGGTGLYISALRDGFSCGGQPKDDAMRAELSLEYDRDGGFEMHRRLLAAGVSSVHRQDKKRVVRAAEKIRLAGGAPPDEREPGRAAPKYRFFDMILAPPDRGRLYAGIERRVDAMQAEGLLEEAEYVFQNRLRFLTAAQAIGYKELFPFFHGTAPEDACILAIKQASRRYAKRQMTWFRRFSDALCLSFDEFRGEEVAKAIKKHLKV